MKNNIRELRKNKSLRQEDLAEILGVTRQTIIAIENGKVIPSNVGIPPQKYSVRFQFGVTKYLIQFSFRFKASILMTELPI